MDVRAFGGYYGYTAALPYGSGFGIPVNGSGTLTRFPACRAIFIEAKDPAGKDYLTVELSDAPGQHSTATNLAGNTLIPISCTAVISGTVNGVFILY